MFVTSATKDDAFVIAQILKKNFVALPKSKIDRHETLENKGFLIGDVNKKELKKYIADKKNHLVLVLKQGKKIIAYLSACDLKCADQKAIDEFKKSQELKQFKKILYYKQIAKLPRHKNVGNKLLQKMIMKAQQRGYEAIICKIVQKPLQNKISTSFHEKNGFELIGSVENNDVRLGVYLLEI